MTLEEKIDMLADFLIDLYEIREAIDGDFNILDHKIKATEARLRMLGVTDFNDLKP